MQTRPLLLLHGALGAAAQFDSLTAQLNTELDIHSLDFSGHGQRADMEVPFRIAAFVQDVLAYLTENDLETVDVFGYSMGGYVGMVLAREHPERVGRLMTLGTKVLWHAGEGQTEARRLQVERLESRVPAFADQLKGFHGEPGWRHVVERTAEFLEVEMGQSPPLDIATLEQLDTPIRISVGDRDETMSLADTLEVYRALPQAQLEVLPGTRHPLPMVNVVRLAFSLHDYFISARD